MHDELVDEFCRRHGVGPELAKHIADLIALRDRVRGGGDRLPEVLPFDETFVIAWEALSERATASGRQVDEVASGAAIAMLMAGPFSRTVPEGVRPHREDRFVPIRYEDLGAIAAGGMGEVRRMRDRMLHREVAVKVILPEVIGDEEAVVRFIDEAQTTAQLQHPGIVPVHEMGRMADGRVYFTMKEVKGRTLSKVIRELHRCSTPANWGRLANGWGFRRVIDTFHAACEAVAYAHSRGVVHRDLKPANIMVGEFGEVLVLDWGLAKLVSPVIEETTPSGQPRVRTAGDDKARIQTLYGVIAGTPAYMPPEQARAGIRDVDQAGDVYSMGSILYHILTGRVPYEGNDWQKVLAEVIDGPPRPPGVEARVAVEAAARLGHTVYVDPAYPSPPIPGDLREICLTAMAREPGDRYPDCGAFAAALSDWLEGSRRRQEAMENVGRARALVPELERLRREAQDARDEAAQVLGHVRSWESVDQKRDGWELEDRAAEMERQAAVREVEFTQLLRAALVQSPALSEAHELLAEHYHRLHVDAETRGAATEAARYETLLAAHDTGAFAGYLRGEGRLTLVSEAPGCTARLYRYETVDRRLVAVAARDLGALPVPSRPLDPGSYLVVLEAPMCAPLRYPVRIGRQELWDCAPPSASEPQPIVLPRPGELAEDDVVVPAGWFWSGGDTGAIRTLPRRRVWLDTFVMKRFPVTNAEYIEFLDDLVVRGRREDAQRHAPRERSPRGDSLGEPVFEQLPDGRFKLPPPGDQWQPDHPVVLVSWLSACTYARWRAARDGVAWRLAGEFEWEKAARGVDGRLYPWGNHIDPTWCRIQGTLESGPALAPVDSHPVDESPYGVRGLGGNVSQWCLDPFLRDGPPVIGGRGRQDYDSSNDPQGVNRITRGGFWSGGTAVARSAYRFAFPVDTRLDTIGFRLVRAWPG